MSVYEHFRPEEHPFIERATDWLEQVEQHHRWRRTDFLDPRQIFILQSLRGRHPNVTLTISGGYPQAERCRALIHPSYLHPEEKEIGLQLLEVRSPSAAFSKLKHKDFLGALLGTGLRRDKFGDILIHEGRAQLIVAEEVADYLLLHLNQIHRIGVHVEAVPMKSVIAVTQQWVKKSVTVPSTRADVVVGDVFGLSRAKALPPIRGGLLKVNWMVVESPSFTLKQGDVVSLRGYGRFKILEEQGISKKGRIRLEIGLLK